MGRPRNVKPPLVGSSRREFFKRSGASAEWNRMEEKTVAYHQAVRAGYLAMAVESPRWLVLSAAPGVEQIHQQIVARVEALLGEMETKHA